MLHDSTPILVGAGQVVQRDARARVERGEARRPMDLAADAALAALQDAGADGRLAAAIDTIAVTRLFGDSSPRRAHEHGRATNPPRAVAQRIGADPKTAIYAEVGGNTPQKYVNAMAERIARGEAEVVLLTGCEVVASLKAAARAGVKMDWQEEVAGDLEDRGFGSVLVTPPEIAHGISYPVHVYPLFEQAIRAQRGATLEEHLLSMGRLFAPFSEVASKNPYAYFPTVRSAEELARVTEENPFIALPYPRYVNARDGVDQGASVVLTSVGKARALGIPSEHFVFLHGCADTIEPLMPARLDYRSCPAIRVAGERAFAMAGVGIDDVSAIDLYSCFPSAVEIACSELGLREDDPRGLTLTGGLPFFGGPGNNYSMHAIAEMVWRLREDPGAYGLVTANGGYLSKHSIGIYSARPVEGEWRREDPAAYQRQLDQLERPESTLEPEGRARIETYTVVYGEDGPRLGIVIGRLDDVRRFLANTPAGDRQTLDALIAQDAVGHAGWVEPGQPANTFHLA